MRGWLGKTPINDILWWITKVGANLVASSCFLSTFSVFQAQCSFSINFLSFNFKVDTMKYLTFEKVWNISNGLVRLDKKLSDPISYFLCLSFSKGHLMLHALNYNNVMFKSLTLMRKIRCRHCNISCNLNRTVFPKHTTFSCVQFSVYHFWGEPKYFKKGKKGEIWLITRM